MGDPVRVLHAVVNMNRGGAETLIMNLYRNIDRSKVQFDFLTCKEGVFDAEIREMGGTVHRIPYVTDAGHFGYVKALDRFFAAHAGRYRIVHAHMDKMSGLVLRAASRAGVAVRIAHSHNTSSEGGLPAKAYKWFAGRGIARHATHLFACSRKAAEWLFPGRSDQAHVVQNGIDCGRFVFSPSVRKQIRQELGLTDRAFVLGHVGRFNAQKNHTFLLDAFERTARRHPEAALLLIGDGPLRADIERKAAAVGAAGRVRFLGVREDVHRLLQAMDAFVFPSLHEGLPLTLVEAQAAGVPCVVSDAVTSEVDMGLGLIRFVPLGDADRWAAEIKAHAQRRRFTLDTAQALATRGYDIQSRTRWVEHYYLAVSR